MTRFKIYLILILFIITLSQSFSRPPAGYQPRMRRMQNSNNLYKSTTIDDSLYPRQFNLSWAGVGNLSRYTITNVGESGYFSPPLDWDGTYDGTNYEGYTTPNPVLTGEFPSGSRQFYVWCAGIWVGAEVPVTTPTGTIYEKRVAQTCYYSDQGALFPLYMSTQILPEDHNNAGEYRFVQPGDDGQSYQDSWIFTDTSMNQIRRDIATERGLDPEALVVQKGDFISNQDSYTVFGDYVPEGEALTVFSTGYDEYPVGVQTTQRTYSWGYSYNDEYIYFDFYVVNKNDFALRNVYFSYFMDTDIGESDDPQGAWDDLIGYDPDLSLGYCYDSDLFEPGWATQAGYIGVTFVETPKNQDGEPLGLTGFQTWENGSEEGTQTEGDKHDEGKYDQMAKGGYELFETSTDVRMLPCSGPIVDFLPDDTAHVVVAVVVGNSLSELKENARKAIEQYNNGYVGPTSPPAPRFSLIPSDEKVYLSWDNFPENAFDAMSGIKDFEGYRIYRSTSGIAGDWDEIADFDIPGNSSGKVATAKYTKGNSTATIEVVEIVDSYESFADGEYTLHFTTDTTISVYNVLNGELLNYRKDAVKAETGFYIIDQATDEIKNKNVFYPGDQVYFAGVIITISEGLKLKSDDITVPKRGDIFTVHTFKDAPIGDQTGLKYSYIDTDLLNGMTYYYSMTSYDRGNLEQGIAPLESGIDLNKKSVVPTTLGADVNDANISTPVHTAGVGNGTVTITMIDPTLVPTRNHKITFHKSDPEETSPIADFWRLTSIDNDSILIDSNMNITNYQDTVIDGMAVTVASIAETVVDSAYWTVGNTDYNFNVLETTTPEPYDYEIEFTDETHNDNKPSGAFAANFIVWNKTIGDSVPFIIQDKDRNSVIDSGDYIYVMYQSGKGKSIEIQLEFSEGDSEPQTGDIFRITTQKPFQTDDQYTFSTTALKSKKDDYSLDHITVFPNHIAKIHLRFFVSENTNISTISIKPWPVGIILIRFRFY